MKNILAVTVVLLAIGGGWYALSEKEAAAPSPSNIETSIPTPSSLGKVAGPKEFVNSATYYCSGGKSIAVRYYEGGNTLDPVPGIPQPTGTAEVRLSGGGVSTLNQTVSADGARYSDGDPMVEGSEHFVFWSKDKEAIILRNNQMDMDFVNCVAK